MRERAERTVMVIGLFVSLLGYVFCLLLAEQGLAVSEHRGAELERLNRRCEATQYRVPWEVPELRRVVIREEGIEV